MTKGKAFISDVAGRLQIKYEDYDVEAFGGADYEVMYSLDTEGREKLLYALESEGRKGELADMILAHFGECLDRDSFSAYCDERGIPYELFTWIN